MAKDFSLSRDRSAIVDDEDFHVLRMHKWYCSVEGYAVRNARAGKNKQRTTYMHKVIMNTDGQIDHINGDKLDNRRVNLRIVVGPGNQRNVPMRKSNTSGYKGVFWHTQRNKWRAQINIGGKFKYLGLFNDKKDAAYAYNEAAKKYHGEFARLNETL